MGLFLHHNLLSVDGLELVMIHHLLSGPYRNYQVTSPFAGLSHGKLPFFLEKKKEKKSEMLLGIEFHDYIRIKIMLEIIFLFLFYKYSFRLMW
jgi:hypothetical protein